jgi:hypothetical protein
METAGIAFPIGEICIIRGQIELKRLNQSGRAPNDPERVLIGVSLSTRNSTGRPASVVTRDTGVDDLANVNANDRVIAVDVPNDNGQCGEAWAGFRCSPASIETKTGLHFFTALPADVRITLDGKVAQTSSQKLL